MTQFQLLDQSFHLYKTGRPAAARATYQKLDKAFKDKLLNLAIFAVDANRKFKHKVKFESQYGTFELSQLWIDNLLDILPEVAQ
jgi:hypothetical protein